MGLAIVRVSVLAIGVLSFVQQAIVLPGPRGVRVSGVLQPAAPNITMTLQPNAGTPIISNDLRYLRWSNAGTRQAEFVFPGVPEGAYMLEAMTVQNVTWDGAVHQNVALGVPLLEPTMWARVPVRVSASPIERLVVPLQRGFTVSGRFEFSGLGVRPAPAEIERIWIEFSRTDGGLVEAWQVQIRVGPDGRFIAAGFTPGEWRIEPLTGTGYWRLTSAILSGRNITSTSFAIKDADLSDLVLTLTDRRQ